MTGLGLRAVDLVVALVDRRVGWHRLPVPLGLLMLIGLRAALRRRNLFDTTGEPAVDLPSPGPRDARRELGRSPDGAYTDLRRPRMGMTGTRFGRNIPPASSWRESDASIMEPSPRTVSHELMTRDPFQPADGLNSLATGWLQFMIRDWFKHPPGRSEDAWRAPVSDAAWSGPNPMLIPRTPSDPTRPLGAQGPETFVNELTHWWDGSSIYGRNEQEQRLVLGDEGRLAVEEGRPPVLDNALVTQEPGFWLGLALLHVLFAKEHNAIRDRIAAEHPDLPAERLFDVTRLVNVALMAKIHTVEWTPALVAHPTTARASRANWFGLLGERLRRRGRIGGSEVLSGIPGSELDHHGVPFSLTEEFVAVYRMHPMIRDDWSLRRASDDAEVAALLFPAIAGPGTLQLLDEHDTADLLYSFGTLPPGLVTLNNFPRTLQCFERPDGHLMDLAAIDVMRTREAGVPRYNEFRRLMRLRPARSFAELAGDPERARRIEAVYGADLESVDLLVGMYAERRPPGLAFSDTALRIFMLMASRRLKSDRFFTDDYRPEIYTEVGLQWIADNSLKTVLLRHHPELTRSLRGIDNAFAHWRRAGR